LDGAGQPCFEILEGVAWDFFNWTPQWQVLAQRADAVCFGTLAQRSDVSRATMRSFLRGTQPSAVRVCDINLRQTFFTAPLVAESMKLATIVKLNHEELPRVMRLLELEHHNEQDSARRLLVSHDLELICVTRGNGGSLLLSPDHCHEHPGFKVKVADTVGAGDAFTAALVNGYLRQRSLAEMNDAANRVGAWVASHSGATPAPNADGLAQTLAEIG